MVYGGEDSTIYWGIEGTPLAGDPSADQHQAFNPMEEVPEYRAKYNNEVIRTFDSLEPKIVYSNELVPQEVTFETVFRDPFMLLTFFTHKTVSGTWSGGAATYGVLTGDFTLVDDVDTIFVQGYLKDQESTNHLERLGKGGLPMRYEQFVEPGKLLKERATYNFLDIATNSQAMSLNNNFHDQAWGSGVGGWANWDNSGLLKAGTPTGNRSVANCVLHWNDVVIDGLDIVSYTLTMDLAYETLQIASSLKHTKYWRGIRDFTLVIDGKFNNLGELEEAEKTYANKTTNTLKFYYDNTANENKYLQFTNFYVDLHDGPIIPASGAAADASITMKGGAGTVGSFSGTYENLPDPSVLVTT